MSQIRLELVQYCIMIQDAFPDHGMELRWQSRSINRNSLFSNNIVLFITPENKSTGSLGWVLVLT